MVAFQACRGILRPPLVGSTRDDKGGGSKNMQPAVRAPQPAVSSLWTSSPSNTKAPASKVSAGSTVRRITVWCGAMRFVSSALVYPDQDPVPLQLAPFPTQQMATETYPRLSATEGMLNIAGDVIEAGYEVKAAVFDAQFTTRLGLRSLKFMPVAFVGRCRTDAWVILGREKVQVRTLAERYRPGRSPLVQAFPLVRQESRGVARRGRSGGSRTGVEGQRSGLGVLRAALFCPGWGAGGVEYLAAEVGSGVESPAL